ncbi:MAG TPA: VWA domain-containing protein [Chitinophagales bacterium]|nr:VWA domain-containing protein [Chitinophagales bacterium]HRK28508.1 VWA domain-containing protein [Chitinophagales bacterium]
MLLQNLTFANPLFLALLLLLPLAAVWQWRKYEQQYPELKMSGLGGVKGIGNSWKSRFRPFLTIFKIAALALLIVALARPQNRFSEEKITADGIDIMLSMDISGSMLARDFEPDRLNAAKQMALEFIKSRKYDRIGLVVFAGESFTQCPATTDHTVLATQLQQIESGMVEDGTAIGMGLATAVSRLQESKAKSKVIILLTDGVNNSGFIDPLTAAETALQTGVKVYTIGVGTQGYAPFPVQTIFGIQYQRMAVEIDETLLKKIADMTGGRYYRATENQSLRQIYEQINQLEKTKIEVARISRYTDKFHLFALLAALCLAMEILLRNTLFKGLN